MGADLGYCLKIMARSLRLFNNPFLNKEVGYQEVYKAEYWLVLDVTNSWACKSKIIWSLVVSRIKKKYISVYLHQWLEASWAHYFLQFAYACDWVNASLQPAIYICYYSVRMSVDKPAYLWPWFKLHNRSVVMLSFASIEWLKCNAETFCCSYASFALQALMVSSDSLPFEINNGWEIDLSPIMIQLFPSHC